MLAPNAKVTTRIRKTTMQELALMLDFDPAAYPWAVAIKFETDADKRLWPLLQAWSDRFYAALRFAMPATENQVDDIVDGDSNSVLVLRPLPREAHPELTNQWVVANLADYLESLKDLPSLLEECHALLETDPADTSIDNAIFACLRPLLAVLMQNVVLWFESEDGSWRSYSRLDCMDGMIVLGFDNFSIKL